LPGARFARVLSAKKNDTLFEPKKENGKNKGARVQFEANRPNGGSIRREVSAGQIKRLTKTDETVENSRFKTLDSCDREPKLVNKRPKLVNKRPKVVNKRPKVTNKRPKVTNKRPKVTNKRPKVTNKRPKVTNKRPDSRENTAKTCENTAKTSSKKTAIFQ